MAKRHRATKKNVAKKCRAARWRGYEEVVAALEVIALERVDPGSHDMITDSSGRVTYFLCD